MLEHWTGAFFLLLSNSRWKGPVTAHNILTGGSRGWWTRDTYLGQRPWKEHLPRPLALCLWEIWRLSCFWGISKCNPGLTLQSNWLEDSILLYSSFRTKFLCNLFYLIMVLSIYLFIYLFIAVGILFSLERRQSFMRRLVSDTGTKMKKREGGKKCALPVSDNCKL